MMEVMLIFIVNLIVGMLYSEILQRVMEVYAIFHASACNRRVHQSSWLCDGGFSKVPIQLLSS